MVLLAPLRISAKPAVKSQRVAMLTVGILWLTGCVMTQEHSPPMLRASSAPQVSTFDQWLGSYRSLGEEALNLEITRDQQNPLSPQQRHYLWTQWQDGQSANPRRFVINVTETGDALESSFAPLTESQASTRRCPVRWQMSATTMGRAALLGVTTASECRFDHPEGELGLVKEWSFDGEQIQVADQLFNLITGEPQQQPKLLEFARIERFAGWAAVADKGEWRVDEGVLALSDGQRRATQDAAGMPLGIAVTLERRQATGNPNLHLVVSDVDTGAVLGQAWSVADTSRIGWANESIQIELTRQARD